MRGERNSSFASSKFSSRTYVTYSGANPISWKYIGVRRYSTDMQRLLLAAVLALVPQGIDAPRISQQDFKKLIAANNVLIVDTRIPDVYPVGHIPGAVLLPLEGALTWPESYEATVKTLIASKKPVVTYCA